MMDNNYFVIYVVVSMEDKYTVVTACQWCQRCGDKFSYMQSCMVCVCYM